jgi:adenine deaminase
MVTINPAKYFGTSSIGGIAPRYLADLVVLEDLESFRVRQVYYRGELVAEAGEMVAEMRPAPVTTLRASMNINWADWRGLSIRAEGSRVRAIVYQPGQITTGRETIEIDVVDGCAVASPSRDIAKLAVVERHKASGNIGLGFVIGFGIRRGAIATSVAHDSHNVISIGVDDRDMEEAIRKVSDMEGGIAIVVDGELRACLPLPIGGLMSDRPLEEVARMMAGLLRAARETGCRHADPVTALSFLALPVIPALKLTDHGLIDTETFRRIPLFEA